MNEDVAMKHCLGSWPQNMNTSFALLHVSSFLSYFINKMRFGTFRLEISTIKFN